MMPGDTLKPPIILFGNFRSGTTMLQNLIALHPAVVSLYEPVGMWLYADPGRLHDEFDAGDASSRVKRYIRGQFLKLQRESGGRIVVEKTPHNILRVPYVRAVFPEAHFIYIVRNPLSFVSSVELKWQNPAGNRRIMKRIRTTPVTQIHRYLGKFFNQLWSKKILKRKYLSVWGPRYRGIQADVKSHNLLTVIARQWARSAAKAERDFEAFEPGRVLKLRYEDFIKDPVAHMKRICEHCGLTMPDEMARQVEQTVKSDRNLKWQRFDAESLAKLIPELAEEINRNGYEEPSEVRGAAAARDD